LKSGLGQGFTVQGFNPNRIIVHAESPQLAQEKPGFNCTKLNKQPLNREPGTLNQLHLYKYYVFLDLAWHAACSLCAFGQVAMGFIFGLGQLATGFIAIGQLGIGKYVLAQIGFGEHVWSQKVVDPEAVRFFRSLASRILAWWQTI